MAIKRRFSFHVDSQMSDEQIKSVLRNYQSDINSTPTGFYLKSKDVLEIEMFLDFRNVEGEILISRVEGRLRDLIIKVTARPVIPATELGPVPEGYSVPLPETSSGNWFDNLTSGFGKWQTAVFLVVLIGGIIVGGIGVLKLTRS